MGESILSKPQIPGNVANRDSAVLYLVQNGRDYRITLATLFSLLNKTDVGLNHVDNTPDAEKPISTQAAQALAGKADKVHKHTAEDIEDLAEVLSQYIKQSELDRIIQNLQSAIDSKVPQQDYDQYVIEVNQAIASLVQGHEDLDRRVRSLENGDTGMVSQDEFQSTIQQLVSTFNEELSRKAATLHKHVFSEIEDGAEVVGQMIEEKVTVTEGPHTW